MVWKLYRKNRFYYTESRDTFSTWTTPVEVAGLTGAAKHGTVLREII
jgi:hypothetical protein